MDDSKCEVITTGNAEQILYTWLRANKGRSIIGEDLRRVVYDKGKRLRHPNCWGPLIRRLTTDRWLGPTPAMGVPQSPKTNGRRSIVYVVLW